jgi:hypothetical protein
MPKISTKLILGVDATEPKLIVDIDFLLRVSKRGLRLRADVGRPGVLVRGASHIWDARQDSPKLLLTLTQGVDRSPRIGQLGL